MSEQVPGEVLDETQVPEGEAPSDTTAPVVGEEVEKLEPEEEPGEAPKVSRFQAFKQQQEQIVLEKERELRYWRELALKQAPVEPAPAAVVDAEPQLSDFDGQSIDAYLQAHSKWAQKTMMAQARQEALEAVRQEKQQATLQQKVQEARKTLPDWDEVMANNQVPALEDTAQFLLMSDVGPQLAYHLQKNPSEHQRLNSLPQMRRLAELGKLEDKLSANPVVTPKKVTQAPTKMSTPSGSAPVTLDPAIAARSGYAAWKVANEARRKK